MELIRIDLDNAEELWRMQVEAFTSLYEKYQDADTSPAAEKTGKTEKINDRMTLVFYQKP